MKGLSNARNLLEILKDVFLYERTRWQVAKWEKYEQKLV